MDKLDLRLVAGIVIGMAFLTLGILASELYPALSSNAAGLLRFLLFLFAIIIAALIAGSTRGRSILAGAIVGPLYNILVFVVRYSRGDLAVYMYSSTPLLMVGNILAVMVVTAGIGAFVGWIVYKLFLKKSPAKKHTVNRLQKRPGVFLRNMRIVTGVLIGALFIVFLVVNTTGIVTLLDMTLGGVVAALIAAKTKKAAAAIGVATILVAFAFGAYPGLNVSTTGTVPPQLNHSVSARVSTLNLYLDALYVLLVILYMILGGIGGVVGYQIKKMEVHGQKTDQL